MFSRCCKLDILRNLVNVKGSVICLDTLLLKGSCCPIGFNPEYKIMIFLKLICSSCSNNATRSKDLTCGNVRKQKSNFGNLVSLDKEAKNSQLSALVVTIPACFKRRAVLRRDSGFGSTIKTRLSINES